MKAMGVKEEFIKIALQYLHEWKKDPTYKLFNSHKRFIEMFRIIEKSEPLRQNIALNDIEDKLGMVCTYLDKNLEDITDEDFVQYLKSDVLVSKKYMFYFPLYNLSKFPNKLKIGFSTVILFEDIPKKVQDSFIKAWKHEYFINRGYSLTEQDFIDYSKKRVFLSVSVEANGYTKASEKASILLNDSLNILRFLYSEDISANDYYWIIEGSNSSGGTIGYERNYRVWIAWFNNFRISVPLLTEIITKLNPTTLEKKIGNMLKLYGIQTSVRNSSTKFVLLITCLESLLLTSSDKDYLGWKVSEKTAFLVGKDGKDRIEINNYTKLAYRKRSRFIHADAKKKADFIEEFDVLKLQKLVRRVLDKLLTLRANGYTEIQDVGDAKNVEEYIDQIKFSSFKA
jgi:hypothetical protein